MSLIRRILQPAMDLIFCLIPQRKPQASAAVAPGTRCGNPGFSSALWESPSSGLQGFLEGKAFNQGDCRVCGIRRREGGMEDSSAGTNQELKTVADPLGDSGSFLW